MTTENITAHVYVQRDDTPFGYPRRGRQSYLDHAGAYERDPQTGDYRLQKEGCPIIYAETLSSIATCPMTSGDHVIVVGAAEASEALPPSDYPPPADYTSSGPTKGRPGPDCSAFADEGDALWGVLAAGTFSGSAVKLSGTSVAAPQIAGQVADQLEAMAYPAPRQIRCVGYRQLQLRRIRVSRFHAIHLAPGSGNTSSGPAPTDIFRSGDIRR